TSSEAAAFDGGFWFSPVVLDANKSRAVGSRFESYATATCDGLLALLAAGVPATDERVVAARTWLTRDVDLDDVAGTDRASVWRTALRHYHVAVLGEVDRALGDASSGWRARLARAFAGTKRGDGSFV